MKYRVIALAVVLIVMKACAIKTQRDYQKMMHPDPAPSSDPTKEYHDKVCSTYCDLHPAANVEPVFTQDGKGGLQKCVCKEQK